jgi:hypothetical protein
VAGFDRASSDEETGGGPSKAFDAVVRRVKPSSAKSKFQKFFGLNGNDSQEYGVN